MRYLQNLLWLAVLCPIALLADVSMADWPGVYTMNHDGHVGTLTITNVGAPCTASQMCRLQISYKDSNGQAVPGRITQVDPNYQHIVFFILFPGNSQRFDAYLFNWDKTRMAGTTVWQGQTFGMFATRESAGPHAMTPLTPKAETAVTAGMSHGSSSTGPIPGAGGRCHPTGKPTTMINSNGVIELHYPDGSIQLGVGCMSYITCPDGTKVPPSCSLVSAQPPTPPAMPNDDMTKTWLEYHNESLWSILTGLLANDQSSIQNYKNSYEKGNLTLYQQMAERTRIITQLTSTK